MGPGGCVEIDRFRSYFEMHNAIARRFAVMRGSRSLPGYVRFILPFLKRKSQYLSLSRRIYSQAAGSAEAPNMAPTLDIKNSQKCSETYRKGSGINYRCPSLRCDAAGLRCEFSRSLMCQVKC
jgi:hypothetical protein